MHERDVSGEVYRTEGLSPTVYNPRVDRYYRVFKYLGSGFALGFIGGLMFGSVMASGLSSLESLSVKTAVVISMGVVGALLGAAAFGGIEEVTRSE